MKKYLFTILTTFLVLSLTGFYFYAKNAKAEIELNTPVTSSYQNVEVRRVILKPNGNVFVAFRRADTKEPVLVETPITDPVTGITANTFVPEIKFTAQANVNNIISQIETYIVNNDLVQGSVVP